MTLYELVETLDVRGVKLSLRLRVNAPAGVITPEIKAELARHKPSLLARLGKEAEWEHLSAQRWGPALSDPTHVIGRPLSQDPDRLKAALEGDSTDSTTPVITSTTLRTPATEAELASPAPADGSLIPSTGASAGRRWRCGNRYCLHKGRWWMSRYGVVRCMNCQPPGFPCLIIEEGDAAKAPIVERERSSQAIGYPRSIPVSTIRP